MIVIPTEADILPPSDDYIFKALLTHPNAERVLMNVISAAIEQSVVSVTIRNNELPTMDVSEKRERLDVNCTIADGSQVNVEMQASPLREPFGNHENFKNKYVYYMTDLHSSQKSASLQYYDLVRTYQITFCAYTVFPNRPEFVCRAALRTPEGELVSDQLNMVIIELDKLKAAAQDSGDHFTLLEKWSIFIKHAPDPEYRNLINNIINKEEEIGMAATLLMEISQDEDQRAKFRSQRKYETDMASNLIAAEYIGRRDGLRDGKREVAKNLIGMGLTTEQIMTATGLDLDDVLKLKGLM